MSRLNIDWKLIGSRTYMTKIGICTIGMHISDKNEAILIDTGSHPSEPLLEYFEDNRIHVCGIISTHLHVDHNANHDTIHVLHSCPVYASQEEIRSRHNALSFRPSELIPGESLNIAGAKFKIIPSPGHSAGHVCVVSPDGVCFAGDALMAQRLLEHAKLPYFLNTMLGIESMKKISETNYESYVLAHSGTVPQGTLSELARLNVKKEEEIYDELLNLITEPVELFGLFNKFFEAKDINISNPMYYTIHAEVLYGKVIDLNSRGLLRLENGIVSR